MQVQLWTQVHVFFRKFDPSTCLFLGDLPSVLEKTKQDFYVLSQEVHQFAFDIVFAPLLLQLEQIPMLDVGSIPARVESVLEDQPIGHQNMVFQDRLSLVTGSVKITFKCRTFWQKYLRHAVSRGSGLSRQVHGIVSASLELFNALRLVSVMLHLAMYNVVRCNLPCECL